MEFIEKIIGNPIVLIPMMGLIATLLDFTTAWIKSRFPSKMETIGKYWDYLRPEIDIIIEKVVKLDKNAENYQYLVKNIVNESLKNVLETYKRYEWEDAPENIEKAFKEELKNQAKNVKF